MAVIQEYVHSIVSSEFRVKFIEDFDYGICLFLIVDPVAMCPVEFSF